MVDDETTDESTAHCERIASRIHEEITGRLPEDLQVE